MSWEKRSRSNRRYYCRTLRRGGRIRREYIGPESDPVVQLIAKGDALSRAESIAAVNEVRDEQAWFRSLEPALATLAERVEEAQAMQPTATGGKAMKGKPQRKSRAGDDGRQPTRELFQHLISQADRGDEDAADRLRRMLKDNPTIWQEIGDLAKHCEQSLIDLIASGNLLLKESLRLKTAELRTSLLAEAASTTLEKLLIEHVLVSWLELQLARMAAIQPQQNKHDARYWQERLDQANVRYMAAIEQLASIRKLLSNSEDIVPISVADQGVNSD